jgi:hypothetical protein
MVTKTTWENKAPAKPATERCTIQQTKQHELKEGRPATGMGETRQQRYNTQIKTVK